MNKNSVFDYSTLNDDHKTAAAEIAIFLEGQGHSEIASVIKHRFKIEEIPFYNLENSEFYNYCQQAGLFCAIQGYVHENVNTPDAIQYPIVCISNDIRSLEKLVAVIKGQ
jgi:hypothetical protein